MSAGGSGREAMDRLVAWLGELGPRWGLPADACRLHGWLYLSGRVASAGELETAVGLTPGEAGAALAWLEARRLVERDAGGRWRTLDDPWELVMRSLETRRDEELGPARALLRSASIAAAADRPLAARIERLTRLLDDAAAIDAQARRLSPATLRRLIGAGGRAARFLDSAFGQGKRNR